ncbi:hypothetical protein K8R14_03115 [bacterium]|nr:hypothetical protein [bacterium]
MSNPEIRESDNSQGGLDPRHFVAGAIILSAAAAATSACQTPEALANTPEGKVPMEEYDPTLVQQEPLSTPTPESSEVSPTPTMMPTEVVEEEVETFLSITEGFTVVPGTREEVDKPFVVSKDAQAFRIPITENDGRDVLDISKAISVGDIKEDVVVPVYEILVMVDKEGNEVKIALVEDVVGESAVHAVVIQDKEENIFATEREDGAIATGVITNLGEYPAEDVETLSKVFEQFVNFQRTGGEFKNGAEYTSDYIFGIDKYTEEETDLLLEMLKRLNSSDSEEESFISKVKGFVNVDISVSENGDIWFTLSESNELREVDMSFLQGDFPQVVESSVGMSEEEQVMAENILDLQGFGVFLEDLEQGEQVSEFLKLQEDLNGCNGNVVCLGEISKPLAEYVENGGDLNSIALAFVVREYFPDFGFPKLGDEIRRTPREVLQDISFSYYNYVELFDLKFNNKQIMRSPTTYGGTFYTGPENQVYSFLVPGDILFFEGENYWGNPETAGFQIILAKIVAEDGSISLLVAGTNGDSEIVVYTSKDNVDNLITKNGQGSVIRGGWIAPELPPGADPMPTPPKADS